MTSYFSSVDSGGTVFTPVGPKSYASIAVQKLPHVVATLFRSVVPSPANVCRRRTFAPPLNFDTSVQGPVVHPIGGEENIHPECPGPFWPRLANWGGEEGVAPSVAGVGRGG